VKLLKTFNRTTELKICAEYKAGASSGMLSKKYRVHHATILRILERRGVQRRTRVEAGRKYYVDHDYFSEINDPDKAYRLGFIMADGYLKPRSRRRSARLGIVLALRDRAHLSKLLSDMHSNYPIYYLTNRKHPACAVYISSNQLVDDLNRHGVPFARGFARFPSTLNPKLYNHFMRGLWDGDGSLVNNKGQWIWSIVGDLPLLKTVQKILMKYCRVKKTKIMRERCLGRVYKLKYRGNLQVPRILKWLYKGSTPKACLYRKILKAKMCAPLLRPA